MDIIVKGKNCEVPAKLKEEAVGRVRHATRFFDRLLGVEMVFSSESNPRIAEPAIVELTARALGGPSRHTHHIRAEGSGEDHRGAVDVAVTRFERQLARYKARLVDQSHGRRRQASPPEGNGGGLLPDALAGEPVEEEDPTPRIVRRKTFELVPMLPEDAAFQLELLGHEFFVFSNAFTGHCNVVYRRRDGELGLIEAVPTAEAEAV